MGKEGRKEGIIKHASRKRVAAYDGDAQGPAARRRRGSEVPVSEHLGDTNSDRSYGASVHLVCVCVCPDVRMFVRVHADVFPRAPSFSIRVSEPDV